MPALSQLKKEIQFNDRLGGLLNVMKSIAAQQFQILEGTVRSNPSLFDAVRGIAATFDVEHFPHPFTEGRGPAGVIAVTSDAGLLGGLNQQVMAAAMREYRQEPGELIAVGRRGVSYAREHGVSCREFPGIQDDRRRELAEQVRDYALNQVLGGRCGTLTVVYP